MKVQIATLVLSDEAYSPFTLHVHDDLRAEILGEGKDLQDELRDRVARHLKRRLGFVPWFFFVMEEHDLYGEPTRPHAHGSISIPRIDLDAPDVPRRWKNADRRVGRKQAELLAGREIVRAALKAASDISGGRSKLALSSGIDQSRNVWFRRPYHEVFNTQWVDYAFKNTKRASQTLGDNRLVMVNGLRAEALRLWELIRKGESALEQWDQDRDAESTLEVDAA
jgi:hypothetical protein